MFLVNTRKIKYQSLINKKKISDDIIINKPVNCVHHRSVDRFVFDGNHGGRCFSVFDLVLVLVNELPI